MQNDLDFVLFDAFRQAERCLRAHRPGSGEGKCGPTVKKEIILAILADHDGGMRQNHLARAFRVSPSTLSEMLNKLEADGMIERRSDPDDRRATLLNLTDAGAGHAREIRREASRSLAATFGNLSNDEKHQLIALLRKIPAQENQPDEPAPV